MDLSDIDKPYAKKMECLAVVRDGSTGETKSNGYWLIDIVGGSRLKMKGSDRERRKPERFQCRLDSSSSH